MTVYVALRTSDGAIKIGMSQNIKQRMNQLRQQFKSRMAIVRLISGGRTEEKWMHERFSSVNTSGEWFTFDPEMLEATPDGSFDIEIDSLGWMKIVIYMTDDEKRRLQEAANRAELKLATWCKAHLLLASQRKTQDGE